MESLAGFVCISIGTDRGMENRRTFVVSFPNGGNYKERKWQWRRDLEFPLPLSHVYAAVSTERDAFGFEQSALFCPVGGCAPGTVYYTVAGKSFCLRRPMQHPSYQSGVVGMSREPCYLPISQHASTGNGCHNAVNLLSEKIYVYCHALLFSVNVLSSCTFVFPLLTVQR